MKKFSNEHLINSIRNGFFYFFDKENINEDSKILSVSCGEGGYEKLIYEQYPKANIISTDVVDCMVRQQDIDFFKQKGRWNFIKVKPEKELPFCDNYFDLVFHNDVLEHTEKPYFFLQEQFRILKPCGAIIFGTPNLLRTVNIINILFGKLNFPKKINLGTEKLFTSCHHVQEFTEWNLINMLKEVGFEEIQIKYCFFGLHFMNLKFNNFPTRGIGKLLNHNLTIYGKKPKKYDKNKLFKK